MGERIRPTVARVDLDVLKANYRAIIDHLRRERPQSPPGVIGVVKANAYGHGAVQVPPQPSAPAEPALACPGAAACVIGGVARPGRVPDAAVLACPGAVLTM